MQRHRAGLAGLLIALVAVPAASADVTVRVEGETATLVNTTVPRTGPDVTKDGATCAGDSAGGALDRATEGDWSGTAFEFGLSVDTIRGESHTFDSGTYWAFDHDYSMAQTGACDYKPGDGTELLFYAACGNPDATGCFTGKPLDIAAPATPRPGRPFTVTVREFDEATDPATSQPAAGARVVGGPKPVTTGADGTATITIARRGERVLTVTKGRQVRDQVTVDVGGTAYDLPDRTAPVSRILRIEDGQVFRRRAPRILRARVQEANRIAAVRLGITRRAGGRCSAYSDVEARFVRVRCGRHPRFVVGTAARVSLLLPERLRRGRYTLDVRATDAAGNAERRARGRNRVLFRVR